MEEVKVTRDMAKRAEDTHILRWVNGKTVAVFDLDGKWLAQRLPVAEPSKAKKKPAKQVCAACEWLGPGGKCPKHGVVKKAAPEVTPVKKQRKRVGLL